MSPQSDQLRTRTELEGRSEDASQEPPTSADTSLGDRVDEVLVAYLRAEDAGQRPDRQQLLAKHPELTHELTEFFQAQDELKDLTEPFWPSFDEFLDSHPLDPAAVSLSPTVVFEPSRRSAGQGDCPPELDTQRLAWPSPRLRFFGNYELLNEIDRGGMGIVYRARQIQLNRIVAVKMILAGHWASDQEISRFRAEAEAAAQLVHPNIVAIHEVGECHDYHYFSMDYIAGRSLSVLLRECPPSPRQAAEYVKTISEAIQYAHSKGVLHRDLKPSNVLMEGFVAQPAPSRNAASQDNSSIITNNHLPYIPKLTDFGLAKQATPECIASSGSGDNAEWSMSNAIVGTPSYMPPEQASGQRGKFGPASDVYSLGAILYEALTGRPPFRAEKPVDTLMLVLNSEPAPPTLLNPLVPRDLETICLKCLSKEPNRRYTSARDLADELQRFINGEPILARPLGAVARMWRWCQRNRTVASLAAVVALGLIIVPIAATIAAITLRDERNVALANLNRATRAEADATEKLWESYLAQARATRWSGRSGRRINSLDAISKAAAIRPSTDLRDEAIASMALPDVRVAHQWSITGRATGGVTASFDADLQRYATYDENGTITIRSVNDHAELLQLPGPGKTLEWTLRFSPDGRWLIAKYQDDSLRMWDLKRQETTLTIPKGVSHGAVDFSPDSRRLAIGDSNGSVHIHDTASGNELTRFMSLSQPYAVAFHPSENKLAISSHLSSTVAIVDADAGSTLKSLSHPAGVRGMSWRPDGLMLATACANGAVVLWDIPSGRSKSLEGHSSTVTQVIFNQSGGMLASYGWDGATRLWDPICGKLHVRVAGEFTAFSKFSRDDRRLSFKVSSDEIGIWEIDTADECRTFGKGIPSTFSPDGSLLAATEELGVRLWDLSTGQSVALIAERLAVSAQFLGDDSHLLISARNRLSLWSRSQNATDSEWQRDIQAESEIQLHRTPVLGPAQITPDSNWILAEQLAVRSPLLINRKLKTQTIFSGVHDSRNLFLAISPGARWIASGAWKGTGVKVWDAETGQPAVDLPVEGNSNALFSPDEKWLVTGSGDEYRFWEVGSWQPRHSVARDHAGDIWGRMAFAADGRTLAVSIAREGGLQLIDPRNGETLAKLEAASPQTPGCFSSDGRYLAVAAEGGVLQIWNIQRVRDQLSKMNLDWPTPSTH